MSKAAVSAGLGEGGAAVDVARGVFVVSSVAGGYGDGVARGMISAAVVPLWPRMRMMSGPVMLLPSGNQTIFDLKGLLGQTGQAGQ